MWFCCAGWVSSWVSEEADAAASPSKLVGKRVSVQWARNNWYEGSIDEFDPNTGMYHVTYDDGDVRWYDLSKKVFKILESSSVGTLMLPPAVDQVGYLRCGMSPVGCVSF